MNHLKLTLQIIIRKIIRKIFHLMIFLAPFIVFGQKDCNRGNTGLIPLNDLGTAYYRGYQGGLFANGSNMPPKQHLDDLNNAIAQIQALDANGNASSSGKIVMIGVGASNPRTEFDAFIEKSLTANNLNPSLVLVNTCIGGQGVQKMNDVADNYWQQASNTLDSMGLISAQVQVAWIETENTQTADTVFPRAPLAFVSDLQQLLKTLLIQFPNLKVCYFSPRGFSGYAIPAQGGVGKGLLFPRDYYNGWAGKWLIQNMIDRMPGYEFSGANKVLPLCTFGSYHWSDGDKPRSDGFYLDCATEIGSDGLHLSEAGEDKIGAEMFNFFSNDSLASQWFLKPNTTSVKNNLTTYSNGCFYPNPLSEGPLNIRLDPAVSGETLFLQVLDISGKVIFQVEKILEQDTMEFDLNNIQSGIYFVRIESGNRLIHQGKLIKL